MTLDEVLEKERAKGRGSEGREGREGRQGALPRARARGRQDARERGREGERDTGLDYALPWVQFSV